MTAWRWPAAKRPLAGFRYWPTVYVRLIAREQSAGDGVVSLSDRLQGQNEGALSATSSLSRLSGFEVVSYSHHMDQQQRVHLELSADEALVFFEFVNRFTESDQLSIADQAEARALWNLCGLLEKQLAQPFSAKYSDLLAQARDRLRDEDTEATGS